MRFRAVVALLAGGALGLLGSWPTSSFAEDGGVVVDVVEQGGAAARAGVLPGDVLRHWRLRSEDESHPSQAIAGPWQLVRLEQEHAGADVVEITGERAGVSRSFTLHHPWEWGLVTDPRLGPEDGRRLRRALEAVESGKVEDGVDRLRDLANATSDAERSSWLLYRTGVALESKGELGKATSVLEDALEQGRRSRFVDIVLLRLARVLVRNGEPERALQHVEKVVELRSRQAGSRLGLARALVMLASAQLKLMQIDAAEPALEQAHELCAPLAPEGLVMVNVLNGLGTVAMRRGQLDTADEHYTHAWRLLQTLAPTSRRAGAVVHNLGAIALTRGQLDAADTWFRRALTLRVQTVPDSLEVADTLVALGIVTFRRGRAAATEDYAERAVEIQQRLAPGSPSATYGLELLGAAAWERGDLARAERCFLEVLEIRERSKPRSIMSAVCFNNLGAVAQARGDYARAEEHHRRALDIRRELAPGSLEVALSLHNLGTLLWTRRDLDAAETYLRQAIEIREKQAPNSIYAAESYANLGGLARDRGNTARAEELMLKALECWQAAGTDSMDEAMVLGNLGNWKITDGDLDGAEPLIARSLAIRESIAPGGSEHALALQSMGLLAAARGMVDQAEEHFRRSIATFTSSGVARVALSETRHHLGRLLRDAGRREEALEAFSAAVDDLEAVVGRLGGSEETHSTFRAAHHEMYQDLIDLLVELGHDERAFDVLERSRARGFLNMLEQRDLLFSADIPEELDRKRRLARAEVQRLAVELSRTSTEQPEERNRLREALQAAEVKLGETRDAIRELAPRLAALTAPRPLDLEGSRAALDPGTVALSYSVGTERSHLFVLGPGVDEFRAVTLEVGDTMLRRKIRRLRNAVATPFSEPASVARIAADLGDLLLAPVHEEISRSRRVLVVPDGPLHVLPFSVLPEPGGSEPLIAALPLYRASSLTVLAELTSGHPRAPGWGVSAFGDPVYDGENGARTRSSSLAAYLRGEELNPLPWTRNEVANLGTLFPGSAKVWLGADASEEQARVTAKEAGTLHFACHGLVDEVRPLESALALSAPQSAKHDGLLQAWEIFESVRTDARLVVLSACRTGLGRELAGEGIVGLTRAFQFAGARSVVASLWAVADRSTAELMRRFYQRLAAGANVAEALRMAQLELASGPVRTANGAVTDASHPYHWAAFQVSGDWR